MAWPVVIATNGFGIPVTEVANGFGIPVEIAATGFGQPVVYVANGGMPVVTSGVSYSAEATALFARFTTQPDTTRKTLINNLIVSLKTAGVWAKLDALHVMAAADSQSARQNWVQDVFNLTAVNGPAFTADRGYAGDGAASYLESNFNPSTAAGKFARDSAYFAIWSRTNAQTGSVAGWFNGTDGVTLLPRSAVDQAQVRINQSATIGAANADGSGWFSASRSSAAANRASRNGVDLTTGTTASTALVNGTLRFGNAVAGNFSPIQFACGAIGQGLSSVEDAAFYAALSTYLTAVGAA